MSDLIDRFVDYLITENCEGCKQCEPRLSTRWSRGVICAAEGEAKYLLDMAERFKEVQENERFD